MDSPTSGLTSGTISGPSLAKLQKAENPIMEPIDQPRIWPKGMMDIIKSIVNSHSPRPEAPLFTFEMTAEAIKKIFLVLKSFDFNVKRALEAQAKSPVGYSSEVRKREVLRPLLQNHPLWPCLENLLIFGSQWQTAEIPEEDRIANLYEALSFGNHKGESS